MTAQPSSPVDEPTTPERPPVARVRPSAPVATSPGPVGPVGAGEEPVGAEAETAVPRTTAGRSRFGNPPRGPLLTGLVGALLMVVGGFGAGGILVRDPVLTNSALGFWRYGHGRELATVFIYLGVVLMAWAWVGTLAPARGLPNPALGFWLYGQGRELAPFFISLGVVLMAWAWVRLGREVLPPRVGGRGVLSTAGAWLAPMLLGPPLFTRD